MRFRKQPVRWHSGIWLLLLFCGMSLPRQATGQANSVYAWGWNVSGQLGNGTNSSSNIATPVSKLTDIVHISANFGHTLAVKSDGSVWAWGNNFNGQLGDGTNGDKNTPVKVFGLVKMLQVAAGDYHSVALKSDGSVWAWGNNFNGQLGDGTNTSTNVPVVVPNLSDIVQVASGDIHSVALKSDGSVWTWGYNQDGELGDGSNQDRNVARRVPNLTGVVQVAALGYHTLALKSDGTVWAWGYNGFGRLGDGTLINRNTPVQVLYLSGVFQIASGGQHSLALTSDGRVWTWGRNFKGQLGDGSTANSTTPIQVPNLFDVAQVAGGWQHSVALKSDGTIWSWGLNSDGEGGAGTRLSSLLRPTQALNLTDQTDIACGWYHTLCLGKQIAATRTTTVTVAKKNYVINNPIVLEATLQSESGPLVDQTLRFLVNGLVVGYGYTNATGFAKIILPPSYRVGTYTVKADYAGNILYLSSTGKAPLNITPFDPAAMGRLFSWGWNGYGQLGNGSTLDSRIPTQVLNLSNVAQCASAWGHSFALRADGSVWAWGDNQWGELGNGTGGDLTHNYDASTPVLLSGIKSVVQIVAGGHNGLALKGDGTVWGWGWNGWGQLGDKTYVNRNAPVQVVGLSQVVQIAAGWGHSIALKTDGTVWTWGENEFGQLGDGTYTTRNTVAKVAGLANIVQVSARDGHCLALQSDGTVWAWGHNGFGQLGDGTHTYRTKPVKVGTLSGIVQIAAGAAHSVALKSDGTVWAWGLNDSGQLGDSSTSIRYTPVQVVVLSDVIQIDSGYSHVLALKSDNTVWGWGLNKNGQLGNGTVSDAVLTPVQTSFVTGQTSIATGGWSSFSMLATPRNTKVVVPSVTVPYGGTLSAKLVLNATTFPLSNQTLSFSIEGSGMGDAITNIAGIASVTSLTPVGTYILQASFAGNSLYAGSGGAGTVTIIKAKTSLSTSNMNLKVGETKGISARLKRNTDGAIIANAPITFTLDGSVLGTANTDGTGVASLPYKAEDSIPIGKHILIASFAGDDNHNDTSATAAITHTPATTSLAISSLTGKSGSPVNLSASLKRNTDGKLLPNRTLSFYVDGILVGSATTGADGVAVYSYTITQVAGKYPLKVAFDGDDFYLASIITKATLTVK